MIEVTRQAIGYLVLAAMDSKTRDVESVLFDAAFKTMATCFSGPVTDQRASLLATRNEGSAKLNG